MTVVELQAFVDSVVHDTEPPVSGHDSRATVAVGIAATRPLHEGGAVGINQVRRGRDNCS